MLKEDLTLTIFTKTQRINQMADQVTTLQELRDLVAEFITERNWEQYHNPKTVSMAIAVEAAELMEPFIWCSSEKSFHELETHRKAVEEELADVLLGVMNFANMAGIDLSAALKDKLILHKKKYPIEKCKGKYTKYTEL